MVTKTLECSDCGRKFVTGVGFSDHFVREGAAIVGCKPAEAKGASLPPEKVV